MSYCCPASLQSLYLNHFTPTPTLGGTNILIFFYSSGNQSFNNDISLVLETKPVAYVIHTHLFQSTLHRWFYAFSSFQKPGVTSFFLSLSFFSPLLCPKSMLSLKVSRANTDTSSYCLYQGPTAVEHTKNFTLNVRKQDFEEISRRVSQIGQNSLHKSHPPQKNVHSRCFILFQVLKQMTWW